MVKINIEYLLSLFLQKELKKIAISRGSAIGKYTNKEKFDFLQKHIKEEIRIPINNIYIYFNKISGFFTPYIMRYMPIKTSKIKSWILPAFISSSNPISIKK